MGLATDTRTPDTTVIPDRLLYSVPESRAKLGGISHSFFYDLVADGTIHLTKVRGRSFCTADELVAVVARVSSQAVNKEGNGKDRDTPDAEQPAAA